MGVRSEEKISTVRRWVAFGGLMLPYFFYAFCWNTENFLRPYMATALALSKQQVAAFYTSQALGALLGALSLSQLADRFGRRRMLIVLTLGIGVTALGVLWVSGFYSALMQRLLMGFFMGGMFGCVVSLYVGIFPPAARGLLAGLVQLVYNGGDALLAWLGRHFDSHNWQTALLIGGMGAIGSGLLLFLAVPRDRVVSTSRVAEPAAHTTSSGWLIRELFILGRWRLTIRLALLSGLNFFAFQAFNGWITTYLRDVRGYSPEVIGGTVAVMHVGSMVGAIFWGLFSDRLGRRTGAWGFALAAGFVVIYLKMDPAPYRYAVCGFAYGFCLVCTGIWGPYFAELFPEHLRATAASIFNWGRVVSLFGALLAGAVAETFGLSIIMYVGAAVFGMAALLWWSLPETLTTLIPRRSNA